MIVGRLSYQCDLLFRVIDIMEIDGQRIAILSGEDYRLAADAPIDDLVPISESERSKRTSEVRSLEEQSFELFRDRKSTRLNSSHVKISYAVFCLKKKNRRIGDPRDTSSSR